MMTITPTVTQASARLKVGQCAQRDEVGHLPVRAADDSLAQVPDGASEHQARPHRQGHGADLSHDHGQHHDTDAQAARSPKPARPLKRLKAKPEL